MVCDMVSRIIYPLLFSLRGYYFFMNITSY